MRTTLNKIRAQKPCESGWKKLLATLKKTAPDDVPLSIITILDSNGIIDAIWALRAVEGHDREIRLFAVWCARQVEHLMTDQRSKNALDIAEKFANGKATARELAAAWDAAWDAALDAVKDIKVYIAVRAAIRAAEDIVTAVVMTGTALDVAKNAQSAELRRICIEIDAGRDPYPATARRS